jgi:peptidoglycan hydrolase-like protein with peptidoglycan-binding domain
MMKPRNLSALLALGALTALPACSMFGGDSHGSSQYSQSTAPASYGTPATASAATGTSGTVAPVSAGMIRKVQAALRQNNDYRGNVDGVWGPMTESGVRKWQQAHNLTTTGEIDMATLQSMNISSDNQANAQSGQTNDNSNAANQPNANQPSGNPPNGNQNYNTGGNNHPNGSTYSNNDQMPANTPYPTNQGTTSGTSNGNDNATTNTNPPNNTGTNPTH